MRDVLDGWRSVRFLDVMEGKIGDSAEVVEKYKENDEDSQCLCPCDDAQKEVGNYACDHHHEAFDNKHATIECEDEVCKMVKSMMKIHQEVCDGPR